MYFAQNETRNQFELYLTFLDEIVANNNELYKAFFRTIVSQAKDLSTGVIDYSKLSKEHFDIIAILANNHPDFFANIDIDNITVENYQQILTFLTADVSQFAY